MCAWSCLLKLLSQLSVTWQNSLSEGCMKKMDGEVPMPGLAIEGFATPVVQQKLSAL